VLVGPGGAGPAVRTGCAVRDGPGGVGAPTPPHPVPALPLKGRFGPNSSGAPSARDKLRH
jgi:hypothetical protein